MTCELFYLPEAEKDYDNLAHNQQLMVDKAIAKVQTNPLPQSEGGYGKPLGHKRGLDLTGYLKKKLRVDGIRVVYKLIRTDCKMLIVVIGIREDDEVYEIALQRAQGINYKGNSL